MSSTTILVSPYYKNARAAFLNELKDGVWNKGIEILFHSFKGNKIFQLLNNKETNEKFIGIIKLSLKGNELTYSAETEKEGPLLHDCPLKFIRSSTCQEPIALKWKADCLENRENNKILKNKILKLKKGELVKLYDDRVIVFQEFKSSFYNEGHDNNMVLKQSKNPSIFYGYNSKEYNNIDNLNPILYRLKVRDIAEII